MGTVVTFSMSLKPLFLLTAAVLFSQGWADTPPPQLRRQGTATQLIVKGQPFLIRGGEVNNSAGTNPEHMKQHWPKLAALNLNTVLVPVYWDLIEPAEGRFDFTTVDALITQARENRMHLVLLWFGSWKNSMSCYAPSWVKQDPKRFPRARDAQGIAQEILTPFSEENQKVDTRAFVALQKHLREFDGTEQTVLMIQVENEIGMIPSARDHSEAAERAFNGAVPERLMKALLENAETLSAEIGAAWRQAGRRTAGTWTEVFGPGTLAEEAFMAWHFATYTNAVAAAGKAEYPLPMFVNAALIRKGHQAGQYPSAGPLPHLADVWRAGAPDIDFLSPDIYFENFVEWARKYTRPGNPLFIPEALRSQDAAVNGLYAVGAYDALGFSPFGIEAIGEPAGKYLTASYDILRQLEPLILAHQGKGTMAGLLPEGPEQRQPQRMKFGSHFVYATFEKGAPPALADGFIVPSGSQAPAPVPPSGGLLIAVSPNEFIVAGTAVILTFESTEPGKRVGILSAEEGRYVSGKWMNELWLSGDQTHQGRHIRLEPRRFSIQRFKLYDY